MEVERPNVLCLWTFGDPCLTSEVNGWVQCMVEIPLKNEGNGKAA